MPSHLKTITDGGSQQASPPREPPIQSFEVFFKSTHTGRKGTREQNKNKNRSQFSEQFVKTCEYARLEIHKNKKPPTQVGSDCDQSAKATFEGTEVAFPTFWECSSLHW